MITQEKMDRIVSTALKFWGVDELVSFTVAGGNVQGAQVEVSFRYHEIVITVEDSMDISHTLDHLSHEVVHVVVWPYAQWAADSNYILDQHFRTADERVVEQLSRVFLRSSACKGLCQEVGCPFPIAVKRKVRR